MREYKFRGIIKGNEQETLHHYKWFYGDFVREQSTGRTFILDISHIFMVEAPFDTLGLEVIPETVGQFTGLHDKNGVEIYDGDILHYNQEIKIKGIVEWIDDKALFAIHYESGRYGLFAEEDLSYFEVIGNIHEEELK